MRANTRIKGEYEIRPSTLSNILIIDTSSNTCSLALLSNQQIHTFHETHTTGQIRHNEQVIPAFQSLLNSAGISAQDLTEIYFGNGPGSFTGCRMSASFAQGLAAGAKIPCHSLSSFELLAQGIYKHLKYTHVAIAQDAQKNQIYFGLYQLNSQKNIMEPLVSPCLINPQDLKFPSHQNNQTWAAAGNAWFLLHEKLPRPPELIFDRYAENWQIRAEDGFDLISQNQIFPPEITYLREASDWKLWQSKSPLSPLKTYRVGGAVRDQLLGLTPTEIDTLVIGSTPEEMISRGFIPVGKHFPVFLHPETHAEFALARTERKIKAGHQGFEFFASPEVTVEEDLKRRDFTMNAIAQDDSGNLIDPYHGQKDIQNKIIRHVSEAFIEDPLRVFRAARFMAQLGEFNFKIAPETLGLIKKLSNSGELKSLSDERIWDEITKALRYPLSQAKLFFEVLIQCGAISRCFENFQWPISLVGMDLVSPLAGETGIIGRQPSDDREGVPIHIKFCLFAFRSKVLIKIPTAIQDLLNLSENFYESFNQLNLNPTPESLVNLFEKIDFFRRPERFWNAVQIINLISQGENKIISMDFLIDLLKKSADILKNLNLENIAKQYSGPEIPKAIHAERVQAIVRAQFIAPKNKK